MKRQNAQPVLDPAPADQASEGTPQAKTNAASQGKTNGRPPAEPAETAVPFFEQLASINPVDWDNGRFRVYVYRLAPRVESQSENHYVGRLSSPIDEADLLARYGSGKYFLRLNDVSQRKTIASYTCAVYDPDVPPRIDRATLLDVPENAPYRAWIQRASARQDGGDTGQQAGSPEEHEHAAARAVEEMAEITRTALAAKSDQRNSTKDEPVSATVANLFVEMAKRGDSLAEKLSQQTSAAHDVDPLDALDRAVDLVKRLAPAPTSSPTPRGPVEQAREMLSLFNELKETFGGANASPSSNPGDITTVVITQVAEILKNPLTILAQYWVSRLRGNADMASTTGFARMTHAAPPPNTPSPIPHQAQATTTPNPPIATDGSSLPNEPLPTGSPDGIGPAHQGEADPEEILMTGMLLQFAPLLLNSLNQGCNGYEFAESLINLFGRMTYDAVVGRGKEKLIRAIKVTPDLWARLAPIETRFTAFCDEFFDFDAESERQDEQDSEDV